MLTFQCQLRDLSPRTNSSVSSVLRHGCREAVMALLVSFIDYLCFALISWLRSVGTFRFPSSGKSVSQTHRLGIRLALPTVQVLCAYQRRSRHDAPIHPISNAEKVPDRRLPRVLPVCPFVSWVWLRRSLRVGGFSQGVQCSASWRNFVSIRLMCRPGQFPPNGVFKWNINQCRRRHRRFRATCSFKSGQIFRVYRPHRASRWPEERPIGPAVFHFVGIHGSKTHWILH